MPASPTPKGVLQIAIVVENLEQSMASYADLFGVVPWDVFEYEGIEQTIRGEQVRVSFKDALSDALPVQLELVEPTDDRSIYAEFLRDHGPGVHHIAFATDDPRHPIVNPDGSFKPAVCSGVAVGLDGSELEYRYFDTQAELGFLVETFLIPDGWRRPPPDRTYPPVTE